MGLLGHLSTRIGVDSCPAFVCKQSLDGWGHLDTSQHNTDNCTSVVWCCEWPRRRCPPAWEATLLQVVVVWVAGHRPPLALQTPPGSPSAAPLLVWRRAAGVVVRPSPRARQGRAGQGSARTDKSDPHVFDNDNARWAAPGLCRGDVNGAAHAGLARQTVSGLTV
ncbi:hypothetical protein E2C01_034580 [Portunus trituberculatus]|uniref:Uncharacterized protein n=1 Tax=Portunus trituberculatus TaxID=210409 RepID=A0A5B7F0Y8_PORTR|nr:hypothetical protein [Portunus trituberculatus]